MALIADTLNFETLGMHDLHGTTINPRSIIGAIDADSVFYHLWTAVKQTLDERVRRRIPNSRLVKASLERFLFELGNIIMYRVDGPHFTMVDPRRHNDASSMVRNAQRLVSLFEEKDIRRSKVVVSIPATSEGLHAAQELESEHGIHTNLFLVSGLIHAAACAEAGATTITIPVGRLLNWYERKRKAAYKDLSTHPGVETIQSTLEYFRLHGIKTKVIGSEFRALSEIGPHAGFDAICISKDQADGLQRCQISTATLRLSSSAHLRARQAQYPTSFLSSKTGFMEAMSAETRSMVAATLFVPLGEMKAQMDSLEEIVEKEVVRQFELTLTTVDLKGFYGTPVKKRKSRVSDGSDSGRAGLKRGLAEDLGLEEVCSSQDTDDVF
ncbi:putative transaldolase is important for the balance of metabolites in the pentose-phosphate pathway [Lyophyllum shimeji]|uniref:Transaldolase is important for the balance of metabolites in the pentose-phosphate pathway n=1 Tax=Lyophyllum shimeji TaxID=47721 RepID=A0A9P3PNE2_LYOSH|nr:putative transaldolase is important for the balance of metabolites in the pentose-phosphate pathway [Lyophyllum shimeji]